MRMVGWLIQVRHKLEFSHRPVNNCESNER